jgi:hypothetical protein
MERVRCGELDGYPTVVGIGSAIARAVLATSTPRTDNPSDV